MRGTQAFALLLLSACVTASSLRTKAKARPSTAQQPESLPHILLLFTDEQDGRTLDPGHPYSRVVATPTLSRIAATGTNFARTYSPSPQCVPGRAATFTSLRTDVSMAYSNGKGIAADTKTGELDASCVELYGKATCQKWAAEQSKTIHTTLDRAMEDLGWNVTLVGKVDVGATILQRFPLAWANGWHSGPTPSILTRGADVRRPTKPTPISLVNWNKPNGSFPKDWVTVKDTVGILNNFDSVYQPGERVFLYSSVLTPHPPMHTSDKWLRLVNRTVLSENMPEWNAWDDFHPFDSYMSTSKNFADPSYPDGYVFNISESYFSDVALADSMLSDVMQAFDASPMANNTFVIFISDHGEMHGEARQVWKNSLREASARVPMAVMGPGIKQQTVTTYTSLLDVMPTLIELAGGTVPDGLDGQSLVPMLFEDEATARRYGVTWSSNPVDEQRPAFSQYHSNMGNTGSFMMVKRVEGAEMKLIAFGHSFPWFNETAYHPQLFNLTADPWELHDLSVSNPTLVAQMLQQMEEHFGPIQAIDATVQSSQQALFQEYFIDKFSKEELKNQLEKAYSGFDDNDMQKVDRFMATTPSPA